MEAAPPVGTSGASVDERTVTIPPGEREASATFAIGCPVAGRHAFDEATVIVEDDEGLFESRFGTGSTPTITVEPRTLRRIHVGERGEKVAGAFGEHATGQQGPGLVPEELREYVPGDPAGTIDWKATARLGEPHVQQYEVETDLETALVVDHRASMATGREGRTKLDFARQVGLAYTAATRRRGGAIGLYAVGEDGLTVSDPPDNAAAHYESLRLALHDLAATPTDAPPEPGHRPPGEARRVATALADEDTPYARNLRPFFAESERHVARVGADPLYHAVHTQAGSLSGPVVTVLVTDDENPVELKETVERASRGGDRVVVLLLPTVLFEPPGLADLEAAYERYVHFEELRRNLARLTRVSAFEVAPQDRLEAVLSARREVPQT